MEIFGKKDRRTYEIQTLAGGGDYGGGFTGCGVCLPAVSDAVVVLAVGCSCEWGERQSMRSVIYRVFLALAGVALVQVSALRLEEGFLNAFF